MVTDYTMRVAYGVALALLTAIAVFAVVRNIV